MIDDKRLKEIYGLLDGTECVKCSMTDSPMTQAITCKACLMDIIRELVKDIEQEE
jgi:hypothetical protein